MKKEKKQDRFVCPYFWISNANNCKAKGTPHMVRSAHEDEYCVSTKFVQCPIYKSVKGKKGK